MSSKKLNRWYKQVLSGFSGAEQNGQIDKHDLVFSYPKLGGEYDRIKVPILNNENMGPKMAIDEKSIDGIMYTILSNRENGKIALMADTLQTKHLAELLYKFENTMQVRSYTRDMASNYDWLGREVFMNAYHVVDKFHVIKQALDSLQSIRIRYRQEHLSKKRELGKEYKEQILDNGDTMLQLLARSRGLLFKRKEEWTSHQKNRSKELFKQYPSIEQAYQKIQLFRNWYKRSSKQQNQRQDKSETLNEWISNTLELKINEMNNLCYLLLRHSGQILNYFLNGETNAKAESLNSQIQRFIRVNYGARNTDFFLYRIKMHFS